MQPETRSRSVTRVESLFLPEVPVEQRQQSLLEMRRDNRPDQDTIAAVITLLNDPDDSLRTMAVQSLLKWEQPAVTMLLQALRSAEPTEVPMRLAILRQLERMGPVAARAETLLRHLHSDPDIGEAAEQALRSIRRDGDDLFLRVSYWTLEVMLLTAAVSAPMIAIRFFAPNQAMPPLGLSIGVAALAIAGLMMARITFADDLFPNRRENELAPPPRWGLYSVMAIGGALVGAALGAVGLACGGWAQQMLK